MNTEYVTVEAQGRDFIDLGPIITRIWKGRLAVGLFCAAFLVFGVLYLHFATYKYTATMVLVPTQGQNQGGAMSQLGSLASLAGIDLPAGQNVSPFTLYPEVMKTRIVADSLATHYPGLMHRLFPDQWDEDTKRWRDPAGVLKDMKNVVKAVLGFPPHPWTAPSGADVQELMRRRAQATPDSKKPILTLTFSDKDPVLAREFVEALHASTDEVLRQQTLYRSQKYARYIENELLSVHQADLRQVLMNSLSQQEMLVMMSNSGTAFAAEPVGRAVSSVLPTSPNPTISLLVLGVLGAGFGMAWAYFGLRLIKRRR